MANTNHFIVDKNLGSGTSESIISLNPDGPDVSRDEESVTLCFDLRMHGKNGWKTHSVRAFQGTVLEQHGGTELDPQDYPNLTAIKQAFGAYHVHVVVDWGTAPDTILQFVWTNWRPQTQIKLERLVYTWTPFTWTSEASAKQRAKWAEW